MNKRLRFKLEDVLSGKHVWNNYVFLNNSQWWDKTRMEEYRLQKLKKLLAHCYLNVPAYNYLMKQAGLHPDNILSLDVIKQLPVINKQYIIDHYKDFIPGNIRELKGVNLNKTSGSTGQPLRLMNDANSRSMVWGSFLRFHDWMGRDFNNPFIIFKGGNIVKESLFLKFKHHLTDLIEHAKTLDSYNLQEKNITVLVNLLNKYPKAILRGYVLNIVDIANILKNKGLSFSIQAVSTTAEPLLDFHRKAIHDTFNCGIFDQYGCGEAGGVAYECDHHKGLHITEEHVFFETDENNEVILTDLDNYSFPFIRYKNGDQAILSDAPCTCGRKSPIINKILGRVSDNIICQNGLPLHWGFFHHLLLHTKIAEKRNLLKFQVIQNSIDNIALNLQSDPLTQYEKNKLIEIMKSKLGNIQIVVNNVDYILAAETGKFKAIISKI